MPCLLTGRLLNYCVKKRPHNSKPVYNGYSLPGQSHINFRAFLDHTVNFSDNCVSPEIMKKEVALVPINISLMAGVFYSEFTLGQI